MFIVLSVRLWTDSTQDLFLAVNDRHLELEPNRTPVPVQLTALLDDSVLRNWWAAYDVYYLYHGDIVNFHNAIISDWRQRYLIVALQLTRTELAKVFISTPDCICTNVLPCRS